MSITCGEFLSRKYSVAQNDGSEHCFGSFKLSGETVNVICFKPPLYFTMLRKPPTSQLLQQKQQLKTGPRSRKLCAHCGELDGDCRCFEVFPVFYVFIEGATDGSISRNEIDHCYNCMREYERWDSSKVRQWHMYSKIALLCPFCRKDEPVTLAGIFCMEICIESPIESSVATHGAPILPVLFPSSTLPRILHRECFVKLTAEALSVGVRLATTGVDRRYDSPIEKFFDKGFMDEIIHSVKLNLMQFHPSKDQFVSFFPNGEDFVNFRTLGNEAMKYRDLSNAITLYTKGIKQDSTDYKLYSNRAAAYAAKENHELAYKDALKCTQKEPKWLKGHYRKALALYSLGRKEEAVEATLYALTLEPNNMDVANLLVQIEVKKGEVKIPKMIDIVEEYSRCRHVHLFLVMVCQTICSCAGIDTTNDEIKLVNTNSGKRTTQGTLSIEDAVKLARLIHDYDCPVFLDIFVKGFIHFAEHQLSRLKGDSKSSGKSSCLQRIRAAEKELDALKKKRATSANLLYAGVMVNSELNSRFSNIKIPQEGDTNEERKTEHEEKGATPTKKVKHRVCATCGVTEVKLRKCGHCLRVYYCSRDCQTEDWREHKKYCNPCDDEGR